MNLEVVLRKTEQGFWEGTHCGEVRNRLPSLLNVGTANIIRLLRSHVRPQQRVLEIGFAPGKILAYLALKNAATVSGIDYSEKGVAASRRLFECLGIAADLRCEDLFKSTFLERSFDFVYSLGFIEHFENPEIVVERHFRYLKPGGRGLIAIPNYSGVYGRLQTRFDPDNLAIHNMDIMERGSLLRLTNGLDCLDVTAYEYGRMNPWLVSYEGKWPKAMARAVNFIGNLAGLLQPIDVKAVCPLLVIEFTRAGS